MLPNLRNTTRHVAIDIETYDPNIKDGLGYKKGYICGMSVATRDKSWYFPLAHPNSDNYDQEKFIKWVNNHLTQKNKTIYGANLMYDLEFLRTLGVKFRGKLHDIQIAEPLIDESALSYSLDNLAKKYLGQQKEEVKLKEWAAENLGKREKIKENIYKMPANVVENYAKMDAELPIKIFDKQRDILEHEELNEVFELESELMPMLIDMRFQGVRVDTKKTEELHDKLEELTDTNQKKLNTLAGFEVNVNAAKSISELCDNLGLTYPKTSKTQAPSFTKAWLERHPHEVFKLIADIRKYTKYQTTFVEGSVQRYMIGDRIFAKFNQLRSDGSGTVSGRFSSSHPNLQFIPRRDPELGKLIRSIFLPEEGHTWLKADYSSIEPRLALHYSQKQDFKEALWKAPSSDIYQPMLDLLPSFSRDLLKTIYLGVAYGMGKRTMQGQLGLSDTETDHTLAQFHKAVPYLKNLYKTAMEVAQSRGYIFTLLKRRRRFNMYEDSNSWGSKAMPHGKAVEQYEYIKRAFTYKAFNSVIQGGAADIMKKSMLAVYKSGIFNEIPMAHLTVHDEMDYSIPKGKESVVKDIKDVMEKCYKLSVPLHVDMSMGKNWGEC